MRRWKNRQDEIKNLIRKLESIKTGKIEIPEYKNT